GARGALPAHADRNIVVGTGGGTPAARIFKWNDLQSAGMHTQLGAGADEALVNFLRGDASLEGGVYRDRDGPLGDFVNSQPVYIKGLVDLQYQTLPPGTAGR